MSTTRPQAQPRGAAESREPGRRPMLSSATPSGIEVPVVVTPDMVRTKDPGLPGEYPYTRGIFADGYRGRLWTFRQYSGFGTAEETNRRYRPGVRTAYLGA